MSSSSNIQKSRSSSSGTDQTKVKESSIEKTHISTNPKLTETLNDLLRFPLIDAIAGRRSRRFCMGAEFPDGVLAFKSKHKAMPLSEIEEFLALHKGRIQKLSDKRLYIPKQEPHMFGHNSWIANHEGSTLIIPVGDLAQHTLSSMCLLTQTGFPIYDDISKKPIP